MTERLRDQIAQLRAIAPQLHAVTDEAARIVQLVESFLADECKLGLHAHVNFDRQDFDDGSEFCMRLEYGRSDGQFRLIVSEVGTHASGEERTHNRTPWVNCTRETKLRTVEYIPHLLAAIGTKVASTIKQTREATATVNELLRDLGIAGKEEK